jgi:hypothetical protein
MNRHKKIPPAVSSALKPRTGAGRPKHPADVECATCKDRQVVCAKCLKIPTECICEGTIHRNIDCPDCYNPPKLTRTRAGDSYRA